MNQFPGEFSDIDHVFRKREIVICIRVLGSVWIDMPKDIAPFFQCYTIFCCFAKDVCGDAA